ncbi:hypothetical protein AWB79_06059 [Caballeronia hypogeia]|uniref:Twin-arginine translocation pathway signal n=1 Tax=Caballeronia hypogeia TaxID=1777140 RepID=A0A158CVM3_9BURK|nr:gluconate 2-dehydrogenase subunit 3 family protein [Caballeronia hypogeia]SAK86378.1 hypothetical protein AWB79_06059 [Caballeronia hypogeia]
MKKYSETAATLKGRRGFIIGAGATVTAAGIWSMTGIAAFAGTSNSLLDYVCDQTIPDTDTPGAVAVGVPRFVQLAISRGLLGAKSNLLESLTTELDTAARGKFMALPADARLQVLARHDADSFERGRSKPGRAWPTVKRLVIVGYYTSEVGGSRELRYVLDPGEFKPDVPYASGDRAYSNDWFGVM